MRWFYFIFDFQLVMAKLKHSANLLAQSVLNFYRLLNIYRIFFQSHLAAVVVLTRVRRKSNTFLLVRSEIGVKSIS